MRNIFDPFGVLGEWKGQEPEEALSDVESVIETVIDSHWDSLLEVLEESVIRGMNQEREAILKLITTYLDADSEDTQGLISAINSRKNDK